jgi:hypothetical protein
MWLEEFQATRPGEPAPETLTCELLRAITTPTLAIGAEHGMPYSRKIVERPLHPYESVGRDPVGDSLHEPSGHDVFNEAILEFIARH